MKVVAVVQARLGSTRLPAKVLLDLGGKTALERCLRRVSKIEGVNEVIVATTESPEDDVLAAVSKRLGFACIRGSETDVLSRYLLAARQSRADAVVRCTSDCPLLDPVESGRVVKTFCQSQSGSQPFEYVSNVFERKLPRGLDTEIVRADALERAGREAADMSEREHVTLHIYRRPEQYRCASALPADAPDLSDHRWTLDTLADYRFLAGVYELLGSSVDDARMPDILVLLDKHPELRAINADIAQKSV